MCSTNMIHRITSKERTSIDTPKVRVRNLDKRSCEGLRLRVKTVSHQNFKIL